MGGCSSRTKGKRTSGDKQASGSYVRRMSVSAADLENVTGEDGDVERDAELAYGNSSLTFSDVSFSVKAKDGSKRMILEPVSGHFASGSLTAIMGPSGCGKSTLLDILAGRKTSPYEGTVHLNGRPRDHLFGRVTAYVPQEDIVPPHWTVKEAVVFNHSLKNTLPKGVKHETIVRETLRDCGLIHVQDTKIGNEQIRGISGGQRRRVAMARGFSSSAQVIFCDEPTSGLSSTDAATCVKTMRFMSHKYGVIIAVVIHQPRFEIAKLFDRLMLFTSNPGRLVYNGPMKKAAAYLEQIGEPVPRFSNPSNHLLDLATPGLKSSRVEKLLECFEKHMAEELQAEVMENIEQQGLTALEVLQMKRQRLLTLGDIPDVIDSAFETSFRRQLKFVFARKVRLSIRDKEVVVIEYIVTVFKAILLGLAYQGIANEDPLLVLGFLFVMVVVLSVQGLNAMSKEILERTVMKSETCDGLYKAEAHIIVVSAINFAIQFVACWLFVVIMFVLGEMDLVILGEMIMWSTALCTCSLSHFSMLAAICKNEGTATACALPWILLNWCFNGYGLTEKTMPLYLSWLIKISPAAHFMNGVAVAMERTSEGSMQEHWTEVTETFGYKDTMGMSLGVFAAWTVVFRLLQVRGLKKMNNIEK